MRQRPTPGELVILGAGMVVVVASFLDWYRLPSSVTLTGAGDRSANAWSQGLSPIAALPAVIGFLLAAEVLLARFSDIRLPARIGGFTRHQLRVVGACFALVITLGELATEHGIGTTTLDTAFGLWLTLVGVFALLAGAALDGTNANAATEETEQ